MLDIENHELIEEICRIFNAQTFWEAEHFIDNGFINGEKRYEIKTNEENTVAYQPRSK